MSEKALVIRTVTRTDSTAVNLTYGSHRLGTLTLPAEDLADFVEGLRRGFEVVYTPSEQQVRDVQDFVRGMVEGDEK